MCADNALVPFPTRTALEFLTSKMSNRQQRSVLGEAACSGVERRKLHPKSCCQRTGVHRGPGMLLKLLDAVRFYRIWNACTTSHQSEEVEEDFFKQSEEVSGSDPCFHRGLSLP